MSNILGSGTAKVDLGYGILYFPVYGTEGSIFNFMHMKVSVPNTLMMAF